MANRLLREMRLDEYSAPKKYARLRKLLSRKSDKRVISGIIRDERRHLRALKKISKK